MERTSTNQQQNTNFNLIFFIFFLFTGKHFIVLSQLEILRFQIPYKIFEKFLKIPIF